MELVQKLIKKTSKYLFYSPLTEKVLTECPCSYSLFIAKVTASRYRYSHLDVVAGEGLQLPERHLGRPGLLTQDRGGPWQHNIF